MIFMKYDTIEGSATTAEGHEKWIALYTLQWNGVGRGIGSAVGKATSRESSTPSVSEIVVTKNTDVASVKLLQDATAGTLDHPVTVAFTTTTKSSTIDYLTYELENVGLSGYTIHSSGDLPMESLTLNFTKITMRFTGLDPLTQGSPQSASYDLSRQKGP